MTYGSWDPYRYDEWRDKIQGPFQGLSFSMEMNRNARSLKRHFTYNPFLTFGYLTIPYFVWVLLLRFMIEKLQSLEISFLIFSEGFNDPYNTNLKISWSPPITFFYLYMEQESLSIYITVPRVKTSMKDIL